MSKIGKVKAESDQDQKGEIILTCAEVDELTELLGSAKDAAEQGTTEKAQGVVTVGIDGNKITVGTAKVKIEVEDDEK